MPFTLPLPLEEESKMVFLLLLTTSTSGELDTKSPSREELTGKLWRDSNPISGTKGCFDTGSGRLRGGRGSECWEVQTFDSIQLLALSRNQKGRAKEKKKTYPSKLISFNFKNIFRVICFSLTNTTKSRVTWSGTSPDLITELEVRGCCRCTWCRQPVLPPRLPPSSITTIFPPAHQQTCLISTSPPIYP